LKLEFSSFLGANSDVSPELLPNNYAVEAVNVFTDSGSLNTWRSLKAVDGVWNTKSGEITSLFLMDNTRWLAWVGAKVDVALVQKASNLDWEIIYTGTDKPRYTNRLLAVSGGGTAYPEVSFPIGIPVPTNVLVASASIKTSPANSVRINWTVAGTILDLIGDRIERSYVYTFVNDNGKEGAPSPASNTVATNDDEKVTLTNFPAVPQADIHKVRIYVAASGGTYNYLKEVTLPATSVEITDNEFGAALMTTLYSPPPDNMIGVVAMANGILAAYAGNNIYFSEPYQSHAWPEDYIKAMDYPVKGLSAIGNMLYISTEGSPVIAIGNHPSFMSFTKLGAIPANQADRSMVSMGVGAMYASRDGIVLMASGSAIMVSDGIISERVYQAMIPSSIHAYFYRDKYVGFYDSGLTGSIAAETDEVIPAKGAFILDPVRKTVTYLDISCTAAFSDKVSGKLYLVQHNGGNNYLYEFNEGISNMPLAWKTKPVVTPPASFTIAKVRAERYPVTFELYAEDTLKYTKIVTSDATFRLPGGYRSREWQVRLSGDSIINNVALASSAVELLSG